MSVRVNIRSRNFGQSGFAVLADGDTIEADKDGRVSIIRKPLIVLPDYTGAVVRIQTIGRYSGKPLNPQVAVRRNNGSWAIAGDPVPVGDDVLIRWIEQALDNGGSWTVLR